MSRTSRIFKKDLRGLIIVTILLLYSGLFIEAFKGCFKKPTKEDNEPLVMTPDELRQFEGFETIDDETAYEYIRTMQQLCAISYDKNHEI